LVRPNQPIEFLGMSFIRNFLKRHADKIEDSWSNFPSLGVITGGFCVWFVYRVMRKSLEKGRERRNKKFIDDIVIDDLKITELLYMNFIRKLDNDEIEELGSIILGLYGDHCPNTVENFLHFVNTRSEGYVNTTIHRVIPDFLIQGGDVDGKGGYSIFGEQFKDENLLIPTFPGCLAMANRGPNTNASQL
jgi:hypothetical protein